MSVAERFREAMRNVASSVAIIATGRDEVRHGMTATAVSSLSMDPPTLVMCVNRSASLHPALMRNGTASVNILAEDQAELCGAFTRGAAEQRFQHGRWEPGEAAPRLLDALTSIEVCIIAHIPIGTHEIFVGEVLDVRYRDRVGPLLYVQGQVAGVRRECHDPALVP